MPREDVEFKASDNVTLRGWFYKPAGSSASNGSAASETAANGSAPNGKLPCLVMSHGFSALKEMDLNTFADYFTSNLPLSCLVFDNRGFGDSDVAPGHPRHEIIPSVQCSDISDAITYAQSRPDVNADKIGIWGSSFSGGNCLWVGAVDRRVKAVLSQIPLVSGWDTFHRLIRPDFIAGLNAMFQADRLGRLAGNPPQMIPVVDQNPLAPSALPTPDSYVFFTEWGKKSNWKNDVTVKTVEALREYDPSFHIHHISPTPLLMTVADSDILTPTDMALAAYARALEPKELHIIPGGHFDGYSGPNFELNAGRQVQFLKKTLCA